MKKQVPVDEKVASAVRRKREEKGWTQTDLAGKSGVSMRTVCRIEQNQGSTTEATLQQILAALGMDLTTFQLAGQLQPTELLPDGENALERIASSLQSAMNSYGGELCLFRLLPYELMPRVLEYLKLDPGRRFHPYFWVLRAVVERGTWQTSDYRDVSLFSLTEDPKIDPHTANALVNLFFPSSSLLDVTPHTSHLGLVKPERTKDLGGKFLKDGGGQSFVSGCAPSPWRDSFVDALQDDPGRVGLILIGQDDAAAGKEHLNARCTLAFDLRFNSRWQPAQVYQVQGANELQLLFGYWLFVHNALPSADLELVKKEEARSWLLDLEHVVPVDVPAWREVIREWFDVEKER